MYMVIKCSVGELLYYPITDVDFHYDTQTTTTTTAENKEAFKPL